MVSVSDGTDRDISLVDTWTTASIYWLLATASPKESTVDSHSKTCAATQMKTTSTADSIISLNMNFARMVSTSQSTRTEYVS
jgi:hypothetical protein